MDDMEVIVFEDLPSEKTPIDADNLNKMQENAKKAIKNRKPTIELLTVSSTAPSKCTIRDKYYNTTTSKIYTAIATNTWGTEGENPSNLYLYVDLEHKELYYFDGTRFVSYGGGSGGTGGDTLPIGAIEGEIIQETGTASTTNVYSAKAIDNKLTTNITTGQEVATNEYIDGKRVYLKRATFTTPNAVDIWKTMITIPANSEIVNSYQVYETESSKYPFPFSYNNESMQIYYNSNDGTINVKINFAYALNKNGYIIVKYTKNT